MPNPIIEIYRGIPVRTYNKLQLRVSYYEYKKFIDAKIDLGLSARDTLENSGRPCQCCSGLEVIFFDKNDNEVRIKRGILCKNK